MDFYGWIVKVVSNKSIIFFLLSYISRGKCSYLFLTENLPNNSLLAKHTPTVYLIGFTLTR